MFAKIYPLKYGKITPDAIITLLQIERFLTTKRTGRKRKTIVLPIVVTKKNGFLQQFKPRKKKDCDKFY